MKSVEEFLRQYSVLDGHGDMKGKFIPLVVAHILVEQYAKNFYDFIRNKVDVKDFLERDVVIDGICKDSRPIDGAFVPLEIAHIAVRKFVRKELTLERPSWRTEDGKKNEEIFLQAALKAAKESTCRKYPFVCPLCNSFAEFAKGGKGRLSAQCSNCNVHVMHIPSEKE